MSKEDIVYLLVILNVNSYANVIVERSFRANEGHIGVIMVCIDHNETNLDTNKWIFSGNEEQKVYYPTRQIALAVRASFADIYL